MAQGKNGGYVRWAKKYNVKQFAESILFLQQHDIHDKETLMLWWMEARPDIMNL